MVFELALGTYLFVGCAIAFTFWWFRGVPEHANLMPCILTLLMLVFMWPVIVYWDRKERR